MFLLLKAFVAFKRFRYRILIILEEIQLAYKLIFKCLKNVTFVKFVSFNFFSLCKERSDFQRNILFNLFTQLVNPALKYQQQ